MSTTIIAPESNVILKMTLFLVCTQMLIVYFSNIQQTLRDTNPKVSVEHRMFIKEGSLELTSLWFAMLVMGLFLVFQFIGSLLDSSDPFVSPTIAPAASRPRIPLKSFVFTGN